MLGVAAALEYNEFTCMLSAAFSPLYRPLPHCDRLMGPAACWGPAAPASAQVELPKLTRALSAAASDPRVRGLLTYLGKRDNLGGVATAQEVVQAVQRFRLTAGARATAAAFAGSYGEAGDNGTVAYMLAAAHGQVYMQSSGERLEPQHRNRHRRLPLPA